jgi:hypothetical protein
MYPDGWPDWITPWPVAGPVLVDGRLSADRRDTFNICWPCLRSLILKARLPLDGHELAVSSSRRWEASQKLRAEAEAAFKGPRSPDRPGRRPAA